MSISSKGILFIDANQYLQLYLIPSARPLLAALQEQRDYIFVTEQVVAEVQRRKLSVTASVLKAQLKKNKIELKPTFDLLEQISQSEDEVSKGLVAVFSRAVSPTSEEVERARARKDYGNPPGKKTDPLGDQVSWEQILSRHQDGQMLWIVSTDSDYATQFEGKAFLNAALYLELARRTKSEPQVFCFDNIPEALTHFASTIQVEAKRLPTSAETEEIKREQESLPPMGWLDGYDDANIIGIQSAYRARDSAALAAVLAQMGSDEVILPPDLERKDST